MRYGFKYDNHVCVGPGQRKEMVVPELLAYSILVKHSLSREPSQHLVMVRGIAGSG